MSAPQFLAADFAAALQALLPRGRVWPREPDAVQAQAVGSLAPVYERQTTRANNLLADAFPLTTLELLPEWEETMGLPDPCASTSGTPTVAARQAQVVARVKAQGGQSVAYFIAFALALGYSITITQFIPARAGILRAGQPLNGVDWAHAWQINTLTNTVVHAVAGKLSAGEPIAYWNNAVLICEMAAVKPAHTVLMYSLH